MNLRSHSDSPPDNQARGWPTLRVATGILVAVLAVRLLAFSWVERLEMLGFDASLHLRDRVGCARALANDIAVVGVEPGDVAERGDEVEAVADAIRRIAELEANVIALDVIFRKASKEDQERLAAAIGAAEELGTRVVLPSMIEETDDGPVLLGSLPLAAHAGTSGGLVNVDVHSDQKLRGYRMVLSVEDRAYPSLALAAHVADASPEEPVPDGVGSMVWDESGADNRSLPRRADDREFLLNFRESYESNRLDIEAKFGRRFWNLRDLAAKGAGAAVLAGKIVFFGYVGHSDQKATTFGHMPGVMLHVQALSDFRQGLRIRRAEPWVDALLLFAVFGLALGCFRFAPSPRALVLIVALGALAVAGLSVAALWQWEWLVGGVSITGCWVALGFGESARRYLGERDSRKRAEAMMGLYFSPSVLEQVRRDPGSREARRTDAVVLLGDLRNFSAISEACALEDVHDLLNRVFEIQCDEAMEEDGSLSNFAGDQFLAYWGAPQAQADAAERALRAVGRMIRRLEALRAELKPEIRAHFGYGFALHRGLVLFGNKGARRFLNYTIIGDTVNVAARLEGLTKHYGVGLLASGEFCDGLENPAARRLIDRIRVKGRNRALDLYQFEDAAHDAASWPPRAAFGEALETYLAGRFGEAREAFEVLHRQSGDPLCAVLAARCGTLILSPPDQWDGAFAFQSK